MKEVVRSTFNHYIEHEDISLSESEGPRDFTFSDKLSSGSEDFEEPSGQNTCETLLTTAGVSHINGV